MLPLLHHHPVHKMLLLLPPASTPQKGEHYHIDDGQDAINNIYACGLIEEINIEPEQDMSDPSKINIRVVVEEVAPKSMEVRACAHVFVCLCVLITCLCDVGKLLFLQSLLLGLNSTASGSASNTTHVQGHAGQWLIRDLSLATAI